MTAIVKVEEPRYFAVIDPLDPERMTYWFRSKRGRKAGRLRPWPKDRSPWSVHIRDLPEAGGFDTPANRAYTDEYFARARIARAEIERAIETDPQTAAARFSRLQTTCCCCGKQLTEEHSKAYGIGPECRKGMPAELLARFTDAVGRAHAEAIR